MSSKGKRIAQRSTDREPPLTGACEAMSVLGIQYLSISLPVFPLYRGQRVEVGRRATYAANGKVLHAVNCLASTLNRE